MTRAEALARATASLAAAGIERPRFEARLLLGHVLGASQEALLADLAAPVGPAAPYEQAIARRAAREPLAHIVGQREFWSLRFAVSPATLIPRPDSETVIAAAVAAFPDRGRVLRVLDLGTGTGCLLLACLTEFPGAFGVGVDIAPEAAALARANAAALGLAGRAAFLAGDWGASLGRRFDLIVCNPPYIETGALPHLMADVAWHEPRRALDGGADGLDAYRHLIPEMAALLRPGGAGVLELGAGQAVPVTLMAAEAGFVAESLADLAGIARALVLRRASSRKNRLAQTASGR